MRCTRAKCDIVQPCIANAWFTRLLIADAMPRSLWFRHLKLTEAEVIFAVPPRQRTCFRGNVYPRRFLAAVVSSSAFQMMLTARKNDANKKALARAHTLRHAPYTAAFLALKKWGAIWGGGDVNVEGSKDLRCM